MAEECADELCVFAFLQALKQIIIITILIAVRAIWVRIIMSSWVIASSLFDFVFQAAINLVARVGFEPPSPYEYAHFLNMFFVYGN